MQKAQNAEKWAELAKVYCPILESFQRKSMVSYAWSLERQEHNEISVDTEKCQSNVFSTAKVSRVTLIL